MLLVSEHMTAHGKCGRFEIFESARHFRIEFESGRRRNMALYKDGRIIIGMFAYINRR